MKVLGTMRFTKKGSSQRRTFRVPCVWPWTNNLTYPGHHRRVHCADWKIYHDDKEIWVCGTRVPLCVNIIYVIDTIITMHLIRHIKHESCVVPGDRPAWAGRRRHGQCAAPLARGASRAASPDRRLAQAQGVNHIPHAIAYHNTKTYQPRPSEHTLSYLEARLNFFWHLRDYHFYPLLYFENT